MMNSSLPYLEGWSQAEYHGGVAPRASNWDVQIFDAPRIAVVPSDELSRAVRPGHVLARYVEFLIPFRSVAQHGGAVSREEAALRASSLDAGFGIRIRAGSIWERG